jgi:hypothetical protein
MRCQCVGANVSPMQGMLSPVVMLFKPVMLSHRMIVGLPKIQTFAFQRLRFSEVFVAVQFGMIEQARNEIAAHHPEDIGT